MKKLSAMLLSFFLAGCQTPVSPAPSADSVPLPPPPAPIAHNIIGGVETLYILPVKMPFQARMDTGAETSSLDAKNLRPFERDGEKWIAFDIINRKNGEKHHFEKPVKRQTHIVRTGQKEHRYVVHLDIRMGQDLINAEFTLNDRSKFEYQVLIGRNIINGRYIIDPSVENTLH